MSHTANAKNQEPWSHSIFHEARNCAYVLMHPASGDLGILAKNLGKIVHGKTRPYSCQNVAKISKLCSLPVRNKNSK